MNTFVNVECIHCVFSPEWKINVCVIGKQRAYQSLHGVITRYYRQQIHELEWANKINQGIAFQPLFKPASIILPFNSLLPVSRYIDTAFGDKGSHQKKNLQIKCPDTS